jgi:hypothetical protein
MVITTPFAGSRPIITSQNDSFVFTPTPSGAGQVISGATCFGAAAGGAGALRTGGFWACANTGPAIARATRHADAHRMRSV